MARIDDAFLNNYTSNAKTRQTELNALAAQNASTNANLIKQLQELGVGGNARPFTQPMTLAGAGIPTSTTTAPTPTPTGSYYGPSNSPDVAYDENVLGLDRRAEEYKAFEEEQSKLEPKWTMINGVLSYGGVPFTGDKGYERYENGILVATATKDENGKLIWKPVDGKSTTTTTKSTSDKTLVSTETDEYGNVVGFYSDGSQQILVPSGRKYKLTVDEDAYTILESTMKDFGLEELVPEIKKFMEAGLGSNQAGVELRKTEAYTTRFKGNEIRRSTGLNVLSEAEYLALEDSYSQTLRAYGLQNYFGIDRKVKTAAMSDIIGNDISAVEFKDRIDTVVTRVNNADPTIKKTLNSFYNITDDDLVKYFLNPKENLPKLQEKVTAAEIGSAALGQGLLTDVARATALAQLGVTKEKAMEGYAAIGQVLPTTTKLGQIYGEEGINYTQTTAEEEVFAQLESARRKRMKLAEKEVGSFSGASGLAKGALGRGTSGTF